MKEALFIFLWRRDGSEERNMDFCWDIIKLTLALSLLRFILKSKILQYMNNQKVRLFSFNVIDGMFYYIKGFHLREFGFPRLRDSLNSQQKKDFKWKKTNFVTDLPKHSPISRYLVAKTKNSEESFFMHASILY